MVLAVSTQKRDIKMCGFVPASSITLESEDVVECIALWDRACHAVRSALTLMHLAGAFIQSELHCIQCIYLISSCIPGEFAHTMQQVKGNTYCTLQKWKCAIMQTQRHTPADLEDTRTNESSLFEMKLLVLSRHNETEPRIHERLCVRVT